MLKLDNFGIILFVSFSFKKLYLQCSFYENLKNQFSAKNSKKFVFYNEKLVTNSKFQTQKSRKLQRFRTCLKNKKCSIFHVLSEYQHKMATFFPLDWSFKPYEKLLKSFSYNFGLLFKNSLQGCP